MLLTGYGLKFQWAPLLGSTDLQSGSQNSEKTIYLLDYLCITKDMTQERPDGSRCTWVSSMWKRSLQCSRSPRVPLFLHLHVFTNLEVLQTACFGFTEASLRQEIAGPQAEQQLDSVSWGQILQDKEQRGAESCLGKRDMEATYFHFWDQGDLPNYTCRESSLAIREGRGYQSIICPASLPETLMLKSILVKRMYVHIGRVLGHIVIQNEQDDWPEKTWENIPILAI